MANWQRELDIHSSWVKARKNELTPQQLSEEIAEKLRTMKPFVHKEPGDVYEYAEFHRNLLAERFTELAKKSKLSVQTFDSLMQRLYDWGDMRLDSTFGGRAVCWIRTDF